MPAPTHELKAEVLKRARAREEWWTLPSEFYSEGSVYETELNTIWRLGEVFDFAPHSAPK